MRRELGAAPPEALLRLPPEDQQRLVELLADARRRQDRELAAAIDEGLGFIPRIARVAVKRVLF